MKRRWIWMSAVTALVVLAAGGTYLARSRSSAQQPARARDPGLAVVLAIRLLERSPDTELTSGQIVKILPFVKALKDIPPADVEVAGAIARAVRDILTPEQRRAMEEAARRARERLQGSSGGSAPGGFSGVPGASRPGGGAPGDVPGAAGARRSAQGGFQALSDEQRAQFRVRIFEGMIRALEARIK
jgi:hypothetical protein